MTGDGRTYEVARVDGVPYLTTAFPLIGWTGDDQDAAWLACRREGIGASEIASVCGVPGAFSSPFALWWAKHLGWETERTFAMRVGQVLEAPIAELFGERFPDMRLVRPASRLYASAEHSWMLASPDYVAINDAGGIEPVECKSDEGKSWGDEPPLKHVMQVWQQCMVLGAPRGHLVRLAGKRLHAYIVEPDPEAWQTMIAAGEWFQGLRRLGEPPDVDGHDATEDALRRLYPAPVAEDHADAEAVLPDDLLVEFRQAWGERQYANERFAIVRNRVRLALGLGRWAFDSTGARVIEHRQYKRAGFVVGPTVVDEIRKAW